MIKHLIYFTSVVILGAVIVACSGPQETVGGLEHKLTQSTGCISQYQYLKNIHYSTKGFSRTISPELRKCINSCKKGKFPRNFVISYVDYNPNYANCSIAGAVPHAGPLGGDLPVTPSYKTTDTNIGYCNEGTGKTCVFSTDMSTCNKPCTDYP